MANISLKIDTSQFDKFVADEPQRVYRALVNSIYKITLLVERFGKQNAPVDTGRLRSSISTNIHPTTATVQTNTNYAVFVHDGTRYMTARPFLRDAVEEVSHQVDSIILDELKNLD